MTSFRQIVANRATPKKSTGPKTTEEGEHRRPDRSEQKTADGWGDIDAEKADLIDRAVFYRAEKLHTLNIRFRLSPVFRYDQINKRSGVLE
jgi:hypothetical protein